MGGIYVKVIIGLGNPGEKFAKTRHNIGYRAIKVLSKHYEFSKPVHKFNSLIAKGRIAGEKVLLGQPCSFMNKSGQVVYRIANYYNVNKENLIIIYDDLDLPVGKLRIKKSGSSGGHNGLKSIIYYLESSKFPRIRIGIGRPPGQIAVSEYVLSYFSEQEEKEIEKTLKKIPEIIKMISEQGYAEAMNNYN